MRQLSLIIQLNQLGPSHSSFIHASLTLSSQPIPNWSWWHQASIMCEKYNIPSPLEILNSKMSKNQLKVFFKKKVSSFWFNYYRSLCPSYSSLRYFDTTKLIPNKPYPYIIHSGSSEYLNSKNSTILKLLCGRYRLNSLRHKFNPNISPMCQMCLMNVIEDIDHFLFICPYLDGARFYALLL